MTATPEPARHAPGMTATPEPARHAPGMTATAGLAVLGLLMAACSGTTRPHVTDHQLPPSAAQLTISPDGGSTHVRPDQGVSVSVSHGTIDRVSLMAGGSTVGGSYRADRTAWHTTWPLHPSRTYTLTVTAVNVAHQSVTKTVRFRTLTPRATVSASTVLGYHQTYGVGMPIMLKFSRPVWRRAAVERAIELWASKPVVGAWHWDGNESLAFRPRDYWPQHTRVRFVAHLDGLEVARGVYGVANLSQSFRIGNSLIAVVNTATHYAHIYYKNRLFGVWPVSTGAPGRDTANGTYLTIEKGNPVRMSGPGYTDLPVPYAVRFTWSGNYLHDAYWSVAEQGYTNVSHGCVNMSPQHAQIYYNLAVPGDPVTVVRSPVAGTWDDGWTEWFLTWRQLLRGSATHLAVQAGPSGSRFVNPDTLPVSTAKPPLQTSRRHNARAS